MSTILSDVKTAALLKASAYPATIADTNAGAAVDLLDADGPCFAVQVVGAAAGTAPSLAGKIQESADGTTWTDIPGDGLRRRRGRLERPGRRVPADPALRPPLPHRRRHDAAVRPVRPDRRAREDGLTPSRPRGAPGARGPVFHSAFPIPQSFPCPSTPSPTSRPASASRRRPTTPCSACCRTRPTTGSPRTAAGTSPAARTAKTIPGPRASCTCATGRSRPSRASASIRPANSAPRRNCRRRATSSNSTGAWCSRWSGRSRPSPGGASSTPG